MKIAPGTVADSQLTTIDGAIVTILADQGAKLSRTVPGVILQVQNDGADVKIFDLEITGGTGAGNAAVSIPNGGSPKLTLTQVTIDGNQGVGVSAASGTLTVIQSTLSGNTGGGVIANGATLTVIRSTLSGNTGGGVIASNGAILTMSRSVVSANTAGGVSISGSQFDITNCFIVLNGGSTSLLGGVEISQIPATGTYRLDFNTITANSGQPTIPLNTGVNCGSIGKSLTFDSNIIYGNVVSGGGQQLGGSAMCVASYSDVGPDPAPGTNNINVAPMFVGAAQGNFHLADTSPARDAANPAATIPDDIDGDARPQGPRRDMGADEVRQ